MGTLRKVKGRWVVDFRLPRFLANKYGCQRFKRRYEKKEVAKDVHEIVQHAIANRDKEGKLAELLNWGETGITVRKFYDRWLKEYVTPRLEPTTKKRYELSFKTVNAECGTFSLKEFTRANLHGYIQSRTGKVTASTINKDIIAVKKMFSYAFEVGAIDRDPLVRFSTLRVQEKVRRIPTREEFESLVNAIDDPALSAMVIVIAECGLRRSEAINLEWKNVNLRQAKVTLERTKGKRVRHVPLPQGALAALRGLTRFVHQPRVFCHQFSGEPWLSPDKSFRAARSKAGLDWITFHTLRHMRGTGWLKHGADVESVRQMLGHRDIRTTQIYTHLLETEAMEAVRAARETEEKAQEKAKEEKA
jgi:site-specific recombinase XerD